MAAIKTERWGRFILSPDPAGETKVVEEAGHRSDWIFFGEGENMWNHRYAQLDRSPAAKADQRVPWPQYIPEGEEFIESSVLDDGKGAAFSYLAFLRRSHPDVTLYKALDRDYDGNDASLLIGWGTAHNSPMVVRAHVEPIDAFPGGLVEEDGLYKVHVKGHPGILITWRSVSPRQNMYGAGLPTVFIYWWEGNVFWTLQSMFLTPDEALKVAESIRPTRTDGGKD